MPLRMVRRIGGSVILDVPPAILGLLNLRAGATVGVSVEKRWLITEPAVKPRYTLDELLAQCDASAEPSEQERAWLDDKPQGAELL